MGVPDRVYPISDGDVYERVPGSDLGVPFRNYSSQNQRVYPDPSTNFIPETNLGEVYIPERPVVSGNELRSPSNIFDSPPLPIYTQSRPLYQEGQIGNIYPPTTGDFIALSPIDLGNLKGDDKFNISLGTVNGPAPDGGNNFGILNPIDGVIVPNK